MLQRIRDTLSAQKWLAYVVLGALALVFAAWGAYGIVNLNVGMTNYAAEAGGEKISVEQARNAWLREQSQLQQRFGGELPAALQSRFQDQVLEALIRDALLNQHTQSLGYRVTDEELREAIQSEPAFQINGKYDPVAAKGALAQAGISIDAFTEELRSGIRRSQLQAGIRATDFTTGPELERARALENQERELRYLTLPADKYAGTPVDDAAVQAWYASHKADYMTPESARIAYAQLRLADVAGQQPVSEADLHAAYDKQKARFEVPEKRHARHILITPGKDDAAAKRQADEVYAQAKSGKDFAELARKYSQDPGSSGNGGDLGWAERGMFVAPFSEALFGMSPGEIRGPVKTQFGYHIIKLEDVQSGKSKSFDEARPELEAQLRKDRATDRFGEIQEKLQGRLEQPGANLEALAKEFGMQTGEVTQYLKGTGAEPLGAAQPLQDLIFGSTALGVGRLGGPVLLGDDRLALVKVLDHRKPQPKPLADVREGIVAALRKARGTEEALKAAQAAQAKLESGVAFDDVAHELDAKSDPARFVGRSDPSVPVQLRAAAFEAPKPANGKPIYRVVKLDSGGAALLALTQVRTGAAPADPQQLKAQARQQAERHGMGEVMAYMEQLRSSATVRKNPKAFE